MSIDLQRLSDLRREAAERAVFHANEAVRHANDARRYARRAQRFAWFAIGLAVGTIVINIVRVVWL